MTNPRNSAIGQQLRSDSTVTYLTGTALFPGITCLTLPTEPHNRVLVAKIPG